MIVKNMTEYSAITLFDNEFGKNIKTRYEKLQEEIRELHEAIAEYEYDMSPERLEHVIDELSDVQGTFTHFASLFGLNQQQMLHNCMDKVINRKTNPDYKRFSSGDFPIGIQTRENNIDDYSFPAPTYLSSKDKHPVAVLVREGYWVKPDPEFYYDQQHIQDAWKNHFDGNPIKMVKCNEQGIQIKEESIGANTHVLSDSGINTKNPIIPPNLKD